MACDNRCATALGVRYASQQVSRKGRKYLQGQRLRRLGRIASHASHHIVRLFRRFDLAFGLSLAVCLDLLAEATAACLLPLALP